jgi:hypothetical protein
MTLPFQSNFNIFPMVTPTQKSRLNRKKPLAVAFCGEDNRSLPSWCLPEPRTTAIKTFEDAVRAFIVMISQSKNIIKRLDRF